MAETSIQWTQQTWNPVVGCSKISPGCAGCYAIPQAHRMAGNPNPKIRARYEGTTVRAGSAPPNWTGLVRLDPAKLVDPLCRRKPTTYFVNSMSDLFHEALPDEAIAAVFAVMGIARQHTFQVLTKRAGRMASLLGSLTWDECLNAFCRVYPEDLAIGFDRPAWPLPNVWAGVSVEDRDRLWRVAHLMRTPAAVRWISAEPLLEDLMQVQPGLGCLSKFLWNDNQRPCRVEMYPLDGLEAIPDFDWPSGKIDWIVVGGESGPGARLFRVDWARSIRDACQSAGVAFFMKQLGARPVDGRIGIDGPASHAVTLDLVDSHGGNWDEWPADLRVREFPKVS